jgi:hypothetical protein
MWKKIVYYLSLLWIFAVAIGIGILIFVLLLTEPMARIYFGGILLLLITIAAASYLATAKK